MPGWAPTRILPGRRRSRPPATVARSLARWAIEAPLSHVDATNRLVPVYDQASFCWLLERVAERRALGRVDQGEGLDKTRGPVGWVVFALWAEFPGGGGHPAAFPNRHPALLSPPCFLAR